MASQAEIEAAATAIALHAGGRTDQGLSLGRAVLDVLTDWMRKDVMEKARLALEAAERVHILGVPAVVQIIERGHKPSDKDHTARCRECETKFTFKRSEASFVPDQRDGDALVINCPLCGVKIWHAV